MAEHKYISLNELLKNQSNPNLKLRETKVIYDSEEEVDHASQMFGIPSNPYVLESSCERAIENGDGELKKMKMKKDGAKKKGLHTKFSSLRHSRSDDPLVYVESGEKDGGSFIHGDELKMLSQDIKNFSWEESILKSNLLCGSEEDEVEDEKEEEEKN